MEGAIIGILHVLYESPVFFLSLSFVLKRFNL